MLIVCVTKLSGSKVGLDGRRIAVNVLNVRPVGVVKLLVVRVGSAVPSDQPMTTSTSAMSSASCNSLRWLWLVGSVLILIDPSPGVFRPYTDVVVLVSSRQVFGISFGESSPNSMPVMQSIFVSVEADDDVLCLTQTCVPCEKTPFLTVAMMLVSYLD